MTDERTVDFIAADIVDKRAYMQALAGRSDGVSQIPFGDGSDSGFRFIATDNQGRVILAQESIDAIVLALRKADLSEVDGEGGK